MRQSILVTGGCGFIGSAFIRYLLADKHNGQVVNLDKLTYAAVPFPAPCNDNYRFVKGDVCDRALVMRILKDYDIDTIVHFAAESHVDRSIEDSTLFMQTNVMGTYNLLECAREAWRGRRDVLFHYVSTDEVYGSVAGAVNEDAPLRPSNPYSASKAAAEMLCISWERTYGLPVTISRSSNNYGRGQNCEKFLPLMIKNIKEGLPLPVYGDGKNQRDWIHADDNVRAIWAVVQSGKRNEVYNIAGGNLVRNIDLLVRLIEVESEMLRKDRDAVIQTIKHVGDRPGHDVCYAMDDSKIRRELGWKPLIPFDKGLRDTVAAFLAELRKEHRA